MKIGIFDFLAVGTIVLAIYLNPALHELSLSHWLIGLSLLLAHIAGIRYMERSGY